MTDVPMTLTTSQVSLILQRAAEIDARGDTLTIEELERIATEAGIDAQATRTAIAEFIADEVPPAPAAPAPAPSTLPPPPVVHGGSGGNPVSPSPGRILAGGAVGIACGFLISTSLGGAMAGLGGIVFYILLRALQATKRGSQLDFQLQNFALWFAAIMPVSAALGAEAFVFTLITWFLTSILGGLLIRFGPREDDPTDEDVPKLRP